MGAGLIATSTGVLIFLVLLLLAVQVLFNLYATTAVTAAANDGARIAAGAEAQAGGTAAAQELGQQHIVNLLGQYGRDRVSVAWVDDPDYAIVTVDAQNPSFLPIALRRQVGLDHIHRTARVRIERVVGP